MKTVTATIFGSVADGPA